MKRYLAWILSLILVAGLLCGCGAESIANEAGSAALGKNESFDKLYTLDQSVSEAPEMSTESVSNNSTTHTPEIGISQKLVRKIRMEAETEDLDALLSQIDQRIKELSGYCENREIYNGNSNSKYRYRHATLVIRIPAEKLDQFTEHVSGVSNVTSSNETADDITLTYIATESRVKALQTEHDRLLELLAKAENMRDLLEIESRLTEVRTELERVASQLKLYDNMVSYGTVTLTLSEVKEYTVVEEPETAWERISAGFTESLKSIGTFFKELFIGIIIALPYLVLLGLVVLVIVLIVKKRKKNKK
jgi:hypothetical protein